MERKEFSFSEENGARATSEVIASMIQHKLLQFYFHHDFCVLQSCSYYHGTYVSFLKYLEKMLLSRFIWNEPLSLVSYSKITYSISVRVASSFSLDDCWGTEHTMHLCGYFLFIRANALALLYVFSLCVFFTLATQSTEKLKGVRFILQNYSELSLDVIRFPVTAILSCCASDFVRSLSPTE